MSFQDFIVTNALEQQQNTMGKTVPFVLSPPSNALATMKSPQDAATFVKNHREEIDAALNHHGVILFRGFPLKEVQDFDTFVCAWSTDNDYHSKEKNTSWKDLSYEKSMSFAVRTKLSNRICTTNEGKSGGLVFHHEQAQTPLWPSHVFFCCLLPAPIENDNNQSGRRPNGGTGIVSSHAVYLELQQRFPEFIANCETHGVRYTIYAGPEQDPSKGAGRSWKSFFHVETKEECEAKMNAGGWDYQWGVDSNGDAVNHNFLKCTTPVLDAVKVAPGTDKKCFFNQLIATIANALEFSRVGTHGGGYDPLNDVPTQDAIDKCVRFGNGDSVPLPILLEAKQICEEFAVDIAWQKGDVALLSNYLMMHARRPWSGPEGSRKLLASLVAEENCTSFGKPLVV